MKQVTTVLSEAIKLLGYQGGTIHQVKADILTMAPMERGVFLSKLKDAISHDNGLFREFMAEYSQLRTDHIEIKTNVFKEAYTEVLRPDGTTRRIYLTGSSQSDPA